MLTIFIFDIETVYVKLGSHHREGVYAMNHLSHLFTVEGYSEFCYVFSNNCSLFVFFRFDFSKKYIYSCVFITEKLSSAKYMQKDGLMNWKKNTLANVEKRY
jgi:hypothetical protein